MSKKLVYLFSEGNGTMRELLGGKGANLSEMTSLGLPVPEGFVVTTEACNDYYAQGEVISEEMKSQVFEYLEKLESISGKRFGSIENPLLVSVRSGSRASMPGMMDTILNLGLNDEVVEALAKLTQNDRFAYDSYRRFIQMYSDVVMGIDPLLFDDVLDKQKEKQNVHLDTDLTAEDLKEIVSEFKKIYRKEMNEEFPMDAKTQLINAIEAVFKSWNNDRAVYYRRINDIPSEWGTAVNVQTMVFGNMGEDCATGVAFTRNPATGENKLYGEFLINAQGEDVVAGIRTPHPVEDLKELMPEMHDQLLNIGINLEKHFKNMQDLEFTVENGKLYILQTRNGKRTAQSALKIAVDLVDEGLITKQEALMQIDPKQLVTLLHPKFDDKELKSHTPIGKGLAASPGAATGKVVLDAEKAKEWTDNGEKVVLVRLETSPEDIEGMHLSEGILTARGGMTSHAAVVARGMGTPCVAGCGDIVFNETGFTLGGVKLEEGDYISLDGATGNVYAGKIKSTPVEISGDFKRFMSWADEFRNLGIMMNADTASDAQQGIDFGAEGIGLVRTEHMFFETNRIRAIREMIIADTDEDRQKALDIILPMHTEDFIKIFEVTKALPVTIRYLDPPLHEFLPKDENQLKVIADETGHDLQVIRDKVISLHEQNPMMGHRGCRLAVSYPEITIMQTKAIIGAAAKVKEELGQDVKVELMVPLVNDRIEFEFLYAIIEETVKEVIKETGVEVHYLIGTCMETPRACLMADEIAQKSTFFSYGTNDLTQMTYGYSRDDAAKFLKDYYSRDIMDFDPFQRIDFKGVGELIKIGNERGRKTNEKLKIGICGEHAADPLTIHFLESVDFTYISISPFQVPVARLAAAQAAIDNSFKNQ